MPSSEAKAFNALIPSLPTWRRKESAPSSFKPCCNSRSFSDISGWSEPKAATYKGQARYESRTKSCADQLHALTNKRNTSSQLKVAKSCCYTNRLAHTCSICLTPKTGNQKLAAKHRMTATHWWQHAAGLQNLRRQAAQPPKEALEMLTVMSARTVWVANKKCSCQPQQRNVMLKCYPQSPQPKKSVNPTVTSLIHSYLFGGKIKHAY